MIAADLYTFFGCWRRRRLRRRRAAGRPVLEIIITHCYSELALPFLFFSKGRHRESGMRRASSYN